MEKKKFNTEDLLNGLTNTVPDEEQKTARNRPGRKPMGPEEGRISCIVNMEKYDKLKTVAYLENIPIKYVVDKAFDLFIDAYQKKKGTIKVKHNKQKGNIDDII